MYACITSQSYILDQTSTIAPTETVSPTLVSGPSSDSVSDGTAMNHASKLSVLKHTYKNSLRACCIKVCMLIKSLDYYKSMQEFII